MTNHWVDLKNADVVMIDGSNAAENHPASMTWINKAKDERGAKVIVVDPRFTRTASQADLFVAIRSGTDIAFFGGMIKYILDHNLFHKEYVVHYTNAANLIVPEYKGPAELDGLFSGFVDEDKDGFGKYDQGTWKYQIDAQGSPLRDETMQNPRCVFQIMKRHYARYTLERVSSITGAPQDKLEAAFKLYASTGAREKTGTILYAMGQTQHTVGSQNVRCMSIIQLLLGNLGRPGGGVNALRGESNVQGSTDQGLLAHLVTGYIGIPRAADHPNLAAYVEKETPKTGYWSNKPKFLVSMLKAWWGEHATKENDFDYDYLPKVESPANHYWMALFEAMYAGKIQGLWILGQNPAVSGPNSRLEREALKKLKWMVVQEIFDTETCSFWRAPGVNPADIKTEVFILPAADAMEKEGSIVTSGRLIQWRPKVAEAPGVALPDDQIINRIALKLKELYKANPGPFADPILHLHWDYGKELNAEKVAQEINGRALADVKDPQGNILANKGDILKTFGVLQADGTTSCGCWIYAGYFAPADDGTGKLMPATKRRGQRDPGGLGTHPFWAFSWPVNRRIIYNRCSADPDGKPWSEDKKLIWWDEGQKKWVGYDVPDFVPTKAPTDPGGKDPFIMRADGKGGLFAPLNEGPLPEHYEPVETPLVKNPFSSRLHNPAIKVWKTDQGKAIGDNWGKTDKFPIVATTYRVVEHWQAGGMSRWLDWLTECQPQMFVEMSKELAAEKKIQNGDQIKVSSARGEITAVAIVTARFRPFKVDGRTIHQIGMPWHFGWGGLAKGNIANDLTPHVGDANTTIPEYKAFLVDIQKV
jgi:formate dehydrogenase major subunit